MRSAAFTAGTGMAAATARACLRYSRARVQAVTGHGARPLAAHTANQTPPISATAGPTMRNTVAAICFVGSGVGSNYQKVKAATSTSI